MNVNNQMYMLFKKTKEAYKDGKKDLVESYVRNWLLLNPENPFPAESQEAELFFQMQRCFTIWKNGDINGRINKRRMVEYALELCKLNPKQPYRFDKKAEEEELRQKQEEQAQKERVSKQAEEIRKEVEKVFEENTSTPQVVKPEEPKKVFGIVPEEKRSWFKFLFPWKKEGESNDSSGSD